MDDGSDRVIPRFQKKGTRSSASLVFLAVVVAVVLGAGCAKPSMPQPQTVQNPTQAPVTPQPSRVLPLQPTSRTKPEGWGFTEYCYAQPMTPEVMRVTLTDALQGDNSRGTILDSLQSDLINGWSIHGFCVTRIVDTSGVSPVTVLLAKDGLYKFAWSGNEPTDDDPFNVGYVVTGAFKLQSKQPLIWNSGSVIEGKTDADTVTFDIKTRKLLVNGTRIVEQVSLPSDRIDVRGNGYCSVSLLEELLAGKAVTVQGHKVPVLDDETKNRLGGLQVYSFCFDEKENAVYFVAFASNGQTAFDLPVRDEKSETNGNGHQLGFWKSGGFANTKSKISLSPVFTAHGGGDVSTVSELGLKRSATGYLVTGEVGGGDGPFSWSADIRFNPSVGKVEWTKQCDTWSEYSGQDGKLEPAGSKCITP